MRCTPRFSLFAAVVVLALCLVVPASAAAGTRWSSKASTADSSASVASCAAVATSATPFSAWGDSASYGLVPGGSFEGSSGWALVSATAVVGNESFYVTSKKDTTSLNIKAGGSATTPLFCGTLATPTVRFFARADSTSAKLLVEVLYTDPFTGKLGSLPIGSVAGTSAWAPTSAMYLLANLLALGQPDQSTDLALRLTATSGSWQADDVYIDPFRKG